MRCSQLYILLIFYVSYFYTSDLYWAVFEMDMHKNIPIFGVVTAFVAGTLSIGYHNVALSRRVKYVFD